MKLANFNHKTYEHLGWTKHKADAEYERAHMSKTHFVTIIKNNSKKKGYDIWIRRK